MIGILKIKKHEDIILGIFDLFLVAFGLSMDAFAVSVCKGLSMKKMRYKEALVCGLYFGGFQAVMPLIGYLLGARFAGVIARVDHWIAFVMLGILGIHMIKEAEDENNVCSNFNFKSMLPLAVATSIDALVIGITFAFLRTELFATVSVIGVTTLVCSVFGVRIGHKFGETLKSKAVLTGGIVLILIGTKVLIEHLFFGG